MLKVQTSATTVQRICALYTVKCITKMCLMAFVHRCGNLLIVGIQNINLQQLQLAVPNMLYSKCPLANSGQLKEKAAGFSSGLKFPTLESFQGGRWNSLELGEAGSGPISSLIYSSIHSPYVFISCHSIPTTKFNKTSDWCLDV